MNWYLILLSAGLSFVTVLADAIIEKATMSNSKPYFMVLLAGLIYGLTAIGWFVILKKTELINAGTVYILFSLIFLALIGRFYFKETLEPIEIFGLFLAFCSIIILFKYTH